MRDDYRSVGPSHEAMMIHDYSYRVQFEKDDDRGCNVTEQADYVLVEGKLIEPHDCQDHYGATASGDPCIICHPPEGTNA